MTAFSRTQSQGNFGTLVCELRSINHRYLDVNFYLPDILKALEMPARELCQQYIKRGKVECSVRYQANVTDSNLFVINTLLAKELCQANEQIAALLPTASPASVTDILRFPGVLTIKDADVEILKDKFFTSLATAVKELTLSREREGAELKLLLLQRMDAMEHELIKVRQHLPQVIQDQRERLLKRFTEAKIELDVNRLEQEMVIFAQKLDVAEEIERTETHIAEVRRVLKQGGLVGRRLDFLLQELNREANTLGAKSVDTKITHAAVEMKVLIEQVREQVQNIE